MPRTSIVRRYPLEVLERICWALFDRPSKISQWHLGRCTLVNLARTCKFFSEPALNVLWHSITDIAVLLLVLPKNVYERCLVQDGDAILDGFRLNLTVRLKETHVARLLAYGRRVRKVCYDAELRSSVIAGLTAAPSAYDHLAEALGHRTLLPSVKVLKFKIRPLAPVSIFRSFHVLFGPKLNRLAIHQHAASWRAKGPPPITQETEEQFARMLSKLKDVAPALRMLHITMISGGEIMAAAASKYLPTFQNLVSLILYDSNLLLTPDAILRIGGIPQLHTLMFNACHPSWDDEQVAQVLQIPSLFLELRTVRITSPSLALPTKLLALVGSPHLKSITITATTPIPRIEIDPLFATIGALPSRTLLNTIYIDAGWQCGVLPCDDAGVTMPARLPNGGPCVPEPIGEEALRPLLALSSLEDVVLHVECPFDVDDALLDRFASSWRGLGRLILGKSTWGMLYEGDLKQSRALARGAQSRASNAVPGQVALEASGLLEANGPPTEAVVEGPEVPWQKKSSDDWIKPRATLFGLIAFAQRCPCIDMLGFELNADLSTLPPARLETRPMLGAPCSPLDTLNVGLSPIEDPYVVAAFLADSFPRLGDIQSAWEDMELESIRGGDDDDGDDGPGGDLVERERWSIARTYRVRWEKVLKLVPKFASIRAQERRWKLRMAGET
ncbi:hypothetical protein C8Q78DRAFT_1175199 [Trametes maxima]|nr:hypothetical protein C8Q78DRAFT_1175199 [Trametes maxima]